MLTDHQKYLVKTTFQSVFFDNIEELPSEIQIEACRAVKSLPYYLTVVEMLKKHGIEGIVREAGEILCHPASQNPCGHGADLNMAITCDPVTVVIEFKEGVITAGRKGIFNVIAHDAIGSPSSSKEITIFLKQLIDEKVEKLTGNKEIFPIVKTQIISEKETSEFDPDIFLNNSIENQLKYLGITSETAKLCDENNFKAYQLFLNQFEVPKKNYDTIEEMNVALSKWHKKCIFEQQETHAYTIYTKSNNFCFIDIVEAKLGRFNHYLTSPNADFCVYRALKRIAFANGNTLMESSLAPDYFDMVCLLIKFQKEFQENNNQKIREIINIKGKHFHVYNGNFLLKNYLNSGIVNLGILEILIENVSLYIEFIDSIFKELLGDETEYSYQIRKALLRENNYKELLSKEIAQKMFIEAVIKEDFECQMLVLAQSSDDFSSKLLLNKEGLFKLVEKGFFTSVKKIIGMMFPEKLSTNDINLIARLSNGAINYERITCDAQISWANPAPLVPQYALARAASQQPAPVSPVQPNMSSQSSSSMSP